MMPEMWCYIQKSLKSPFHYFFLFPVFPRSPKREMRSYSFLAVTGAGAAAGTAFLSADPEAGLSPVAESPLGPPVDPNRLPPRPPRMDPRECPPRPRPLKSEDPIRGGGLETTTVMTVSRIFYQSACDPGSRRQRAHLLVVLESLLSVRLSSKVDIRKLLVLLLQLVIGDLDKGNLYVSLLSASSESSLPCSSVRGREP
jgi:hypothetical protein